MKNHLPAFFIGARQIATYNNIIQQLLFLNKLISCTKHYLLKFITEKFYRQSQSEQNKSAITDHVNTENHIINCDEVTIIGRESDRTTRWIREVVKIRQESQGIMNRYKSLPAEPRLC